MSIAQPIPPDVSTLVERPESATHMKRVKAKTAVNVRMGPGVIYDKVNKGMKDMLVQPDTILTYYTPGIEDGKGREWVFCLIETEKYAGARGWVSKNDFEKESLGATQELPKIKPPIVDNPVAPPVPEVDEGKPAEAPVEAQKPELTREIRIVVTASDEKVLELTTAVLALVASLTDLANAWRAVREQTPVIEVKDIQVQVEETPS